MEEDYFNTTLHESRVQVLLDQKSRLLQQVEKIDHALANYNFKVNKSMPVFSIPIEVLTYIYRLAQISTSLEGPTNEIPFEFIATHVCSHWRSSAIGTPELWSRLILSSRRDLLEPNKRRRMQWKSNNETYITIISLYAARSQKRPLSFDLSLRQEECRPVFECISSFSDRLQAVHLDAMTPAPETYNLLLEMSAPILESISFRIHAIDIRPSEDPGESITLLPILGGGSPRLRSFRLSAPPLLTYIPPLKNIRNLDLEWKWGNVIYSDFLDLLEPLQNLEEFNLSWGVEPMDDVWSPKRFSLPNLQKLSLFRFPTLSMFTTYITLPKIKVVSLRGVDMRDGMFPEAPYLPTVEVFFRRGCATDLWELGSSVVTSFPNLTTLIISDAYDQVFDFSIGSKGWRKRSDNDNVGNNGAASAVGVSEDDVAAIAWPKLTTLAFGNDAQIENEEFVAEIVSRGTAGHPVDLIKVCYEPEGDRDEARFQRAVERLETFSRVERYDWTKYEEMLESLGILLPFDTE